MLRRLSSSPALVALLIGVVSCKSGGSGSGTPAVADSSAIRRDIAYLASDDLQGRATGTRGNDTAAMYIARRFRALGLSPLICDTTPGRIISVETHMGPAGSHVEKSRGNTTRPMPKVPGRECPGTYLQRFTPSSIAAAHAGISSALPTQNVIGAVRGTDPKLRNEYVIVGAHFDHLGRMGFGVLDADSANAIHNGADDNASGTAAVLELARLISRNPTKRSVAFVAFSAEELGLLGSAHFVENAPVPVDSMVAMLNFDMVGRLKDDRLIIYGVATASEFGAILDSANMEPRLRVTATGDGFGSSDHSSFYVKNMPVLHFFTDVHSEYHRSTDDIGLINAHGTARIVSMAERVLRNVANRPGRLTFKRPVAPTSRMSTCRNSEVSAGTIPNMGATDVGGLQLSGVREGGPAQKGGLAAGDVVIEFGGKTVKDLYEYTDALCSHKPGDSVQVVVRRNGELKTFTVVLGKRGT